MFQHTAARRRLALKPFGVTAKITVSTHSRPKAAGFGQRELMLIDNVFQHTAARRRLGIKAIRRDCKDYSFNTQPPEGGW